MSNHLAVLAADIQAAHLDMRASAERMAERAITAGHLLVEAKAALKHGAWRGWLADHVGISERTARRYMQLASSGLETATVADLGIRGAAEVISRHKPKKAINPDDAQGWTLPAASGGWVDISSPDANWFALVWRDGHDPEGTFDFIAMGPPCEDGAASGFVAKRPMRALGISRALAVAGFKLDTSIVTSFQHELPLEFRRFTWDFMAVVLRAEVSR